MPGAKLAYGSPQWMREQMPSTVPANEEFYSDFLRLIQFVNALETKLLTLENKIKQLEEKLNNS